MSDRPPLACLQPGRIALLEQRELNDWNGIDYLELEHPENSPTSVRLKVKFVHKIEPPDGWERRVRIEGGVRFPAPQVKRVALSGDRADQLIVEYQGPTDGSTYTLRLVKSPGSDEPPAGIDPQLSSVSFTFTSLCPSDFDCKPSSDCPPEEDEAPQIDYLAKDYLSFRQLMLDRLALLMPQGVEQSPADLQIALVEVLAYAADYLSYAQDAAATEGYLGTARRRTSLRRHARHLDYSVDDGQNARAWVHLRTSASGLHVPKGTPLVTKHSPTIALEETAYDAAIRAGHTVFETMHDAILYEPHNEIKLYTWGNRECCLPAGSTSAALHSQGLLDGLEVGMALLLEEVRSPITGQESDADREKRHVVRLVEVGKEVEDPLVEDASGIPARVRVVKWSLEDALPFSMLLTAPNDVQSVVVRGNMVLADHGRTSPEEELDEPATDGRIRLTRGPISRIARATKRTGAIIRGEDNKPLAYDPKGPASLAVDPRSSIVVPSIELAEGAGKQATQTWYPQSDLLRSGRFAAEFVVETENDGTAYLRFGDGVFGKARPNAAKAKYRVGNGTAGNVGPESLAHIHGPYAAIEEVRNPLAARGGRDPEPAEAIRTYAPLAFQTQLRAVTEADYAEVLGRHPEVQRAKALRRWTGSWYTMVVLVDRKGGRPVDEEFQAELTTYLEQFRMAGIDVEIAKPAYVALDIAMTVCTKPDSIRANVRQALLRAFSSAKGGFFDPDAWTFNQDVFLSSVIERAMRVPGVASVDFLGGNRHRFHRYGQDAGTEIADGVIVIDDTEIVRLDNDPVFPENGRIEFYMEGSGR